ncbi:MAG: hypothetical protein HY202_05875 [Nitrospirae bacterium]|nr:hypothetical protein [Nitrospirota bacterium]
MIFQKQQYIISIAFVLAALSILAGCMARKNQYETFADYPGFKEYYVSRCSPDQSNRTAAIVDQNLLEQFRPRLVLPPGGPYPIDFYKEYLPYSVLKRYLDGKTIANTVNPELLKTIQDDTRYYLDFQFDRYRANARDRRYSISRQDSIPANERSTVYGRVYRETVFFQTENGKRQSKELIFLKYNVVFAISGLPSQLPFGQETGLKLAGLDPEDWHQLDNFVAVHVVLDEQEKPIAVILAQHNHHRTYLIGKDLPFPPDGRLAFDVARRSNELYPDSDSAETQRHRVIRWDIYLRYLLSGEDPPFFQAYDVTYGRRAGGGEVGYDLAFLPPCDPFYTAKIMLGGSRPLFGRYYIGRDGPPGADYYTIPALLPPGNLLKFFYLHDGDPDDIRMVESAINVKKGTIDYDRILEYGGSKFIQDLNRIQGGAVNVLN